MSLVIHLIMPMQLIQTGFGVCFCTTCLSADLEDLASLWIKKHIRIKLSLRIIIHII